MRHAAPIDSKSLIRRNINKTNNINVYVRLGTTHRYSGRRVVGMLHAQYFAACDHPSARLDKIDKDWLFDKMINLNYNDE